MTIEQRIIEARKNENSKWHKPKIGIYHASQIYDICQYPDRIARDFFKEQNLSDQTIITFAIGQMYHDFIQSFYPKECKEKKISIEIDGCKIIGRVDLLLDNIPCELKTCSEFPKKPYESHIYQLMCYLHALQLQEGIISYIKKDPRSFQTKNYRVKYDNKTMELIIKKVIEFDNKLKSL